MYELLDAFGAVFIGAYINNIFTWRIQGRITAIDNLSASLLKLKNRLCVEIRNFKAGKNSQIDLLNFDDIWSLILVNDEILERRFSLRMNDLTSKLMVLIDDPNSINPETTSGVIEVIHGMVMEISNYRREVESFRYMLRELYTPLRRLICNYC